MTAIRITVPDTLRELADEFVLALLDVERAADVTDVDLPRLELEPVERQCESVGGIFG